MKRVPLGLGALSTKVIVNQGVKLDSSALHVACAGQESKTKELQVNQTVAVYQLTLTLCSFHLKGPDLVFCLKSVH